MKHYTSFLLIITILGLTVSLPVWAANNPYWRFSEMQIVNPVDYRQYDLKGLATVTGIIKDFYIVEYTYPNCPVRVLGLKLQTADGLTYRAHLAPPNMLMNRNWYLRLGDEISLQGVWMKVDNGQALIAGKVYRRDKQLSLRDNYGLPKWEYAQEVGSFSKDSFTPELH